MEKDSAFKNLINSEVVESIAIEISKAYPAFDKREFIKISSELTPLELKARVLLIASALKKYLPSDYLKALKILTAVIKTEKLEGFTLWPFSEFIAQNGLENFDESMQAMHLLTQHFTSEFAVRPFFIKDHQKVLKYFKKYAKDENHHVRRWVSEGSRPLLPWGLRLPIFVENPKHTIALLDLLKFDEELYVRKSIANHLNDISKHHPLLVIETVARWEKACPSKHAPKISWIKKQALRTLIKKGDLRALKLMGVSGSAKIKMNSIELDRKKYKLHDKLDFSFEISSLGSQKQKLVIDYLVHFMKSNGSTSSKVFKLKTIDILPKEKVKIKKSHSLKPITTMVYYRGKHQISIQVNGKICSTKEWYFDV